MKSRSKTIPRLCFAALVLLTQAVGAATFTNDTVIHSFDTNYDGAEIVVSNCTLTVNGPHTFSNLLVAAGATLTHTFSANGTVSVQRSFVDEAQVLNGTNAVTLLNSGTTLISNKVTDIGKTVTYTNNQDYSIIPPFGGVIQLLRTTNSTIPDGATVLVSYTVSVSTPAGLNLTVSGNAEVATGGAVNVNGQGYWNTGPGKPNLISAGAGYGGTGGMNSSNGPGGISYGSAEQPSSLGSGGGSGAGGVGAGGFGGGATKLTVGGTLTINGQISACGTDGTNNRSGGGSGGSIWLTAQTITGAGSIAANGGAGEPVHGGGGAGGRIALWADSINFTGPITAYGGVGAQNGGAGTVYTKPITQNGLLIVDNGGLPGKSGNTTVGPAAGTSVIVRGGGIAIPATVLTVSNLFIGSNSWLIGLATLTDLGDTTIEGGGGISVDGATISFGTGSGSPVSNLPNYCGGGGHGGYGGAGGTAGIRGGAGTTHDSTVSPTSPGGRGGGAGSVPPLGGAGGGVIRLTVNGKLTVNGRISAEGTGGTGGYAGGGAGGSIWLTLGTLAGSGAISANGGPGVFGGGAGGGGGGGGRIAIYFNTNLFSGNITAYGANGFVRGGAGTVYLKDAQNPSQLVLDNGGNAGTNTTVDAASSLGNFIITGGAIWQLPSFASVGNLFVLPNGAISTPGGTLNVSGNATIDAGGAISLDGTASSGASGGQGFSSSNQPRGGGGHGGFGGLNGGFSGNSYGNITSPTTTGSSGGGGGGITGIPVSGGAGGGAVRINVTGALTVNGRISANGKPGDPDLGGGSGGSIWITNTLFTGSGLISANGGATGSAGGGAGGRIAITYSSNEFTGVLSASGGAGFVGGGAGTIYTKGGGTSTPKVIVDNNGVSGTNTPLSTGLMIFPASCDLTISGGAAAVPFSSLPVLNNLNIGPGSFLAIPPGFGISLAVTVQHDVTIAAGGAISVDGKGYLRGMGPGKGTSIANKGSGGGYGGRGGASASGAPGGTNYGSATQPVDWGSGGGTVNNGGGSDGGGAVRLYVGGTLSVDGLLSANGTAGSQDDSGGGAGGGIWIKANTLTGIGTISANGGPGDLYGGGGGGGGRIAIYSPTNTFSGLLTALGGNGGSMGQTGTVYLANFLPPFEVISQSRSGTVNNTVQTLTLGFSDPVSAASVSLSDFKMFGPAGPLASNSFSAFVSSSTAVQLTFSPLLSLVGNYRIEAGPDLSDLIGNPMSQVYTGAFAVELPTISGKVTDTNGLPVAGVSVQPDGNLMASTTDSNGDYALGVPPGWAGSVTPAFAPFMFVPGTRAYTNINASITNENYLMVSTIAPALAGGRQNTNLLVSWFGIPGVTYQLYSSTNLIDWSPIGAPFVGSNGIVELPLLIDSDLKKFIRVKAAN